MDDNLVFVAMSTSTTIDSVHFPVVSKPMKDNTDKIAMTLS